MQGSFHPRKRLVSEMLRSGMITTQTGIIDVSSIVDDRTVKTNIDKLARFLHAYYCSCIRQMNGDNSLKTWYSKHACQPIYPELQREIEGGDLRMAKITYDENNNITLKVKTVGSYEELKLNNSFTIPILSYEKQITIQELTYLGLKASMFLGVHSETLILTALQDICEISGIVVQNDYMKNFMDPLFQPIPDDYKYLVGLKLIALIGAQFTTDTGILENDFEKTFGIKPEIQQIVKDLDFDQKRQVRARPEENKLDEEYAILVKGSAVNTGIQTVWHPLLKEGIDNYDQQQFAEVMWKAIQKYVEAFAKQYWDGTLSQQAMQRQREILANNIIGIRRELKDIWYGVFQWDVSTEVRSVEYEIVYRLIRESNGCTIPPGETKKIDDLIKFMRHDKVVRPLFAGAVGKRFMSERIISRGRTSLVEHHRAVKWAESSFQMLKEIRPMVMFRQNQDNVLAQRRDEVEETRALLETHRQELDQVHLRIEGAKRDLKRVQSELEIEKRRLLVGHLNFE